MEHWGPERIRSPILLSSGLYVNSLGLQWCQLDPFVTLPGSGRVRSSCSWSRPGCFFMCILIVCICMEQVKSIHPISREWWQRFMWKLNVPGFCPKENVLTKYFCSASLSLACCQLLYQELCWENKLHKGISNTDPIYFMDGALLWEYALYKAFYNLGSRLSAFCILLVSFIGILSTCSFQYILLLMFVSQLILIPVTRLCLCQVIEISEYRTQLYDYLKNRMMAIAPNLTVMVGELVGARLIAHAGGLHCYSDQCK